MNWIQINFAYPLVLGLIPLSILLAILSRFFLKQKQLAILFPWLSLIQTSVFSQMRVWAQKACLICLWVGWTLWIVALARPQKHDEIHNTQILGTDILLVLDTSQSMEIEDLKPSRFKVALATLEKFIRARKNDRMGLVVFGGESFTLVPLTLDQDLLISALKKAEPDMTRVQGTAIGTALANAVARIKDSKAKSRVIILLTDGANNQGAIDPITAADLAKGFGIRVYTIGVGQEGQVPLPVRGKNIFGQDVKYYQNVTSSVDHPLLEEIAKKTAGVAFRADDPKSLQSVFERIDKLEKSKIEGLKSSKVTEMFRWPLLIGTILLGIGQFFLGTLLRMFP